ncbi:ABC transporter substrate-binding protein [Anaerocolumna xylanovorans]|uniref:NitT/TauT family transport system substrate-binding protein n=1 Tax=Anaerocolumna xylanovorans DSM 12503 TaxID=1121345 RepID=A0A1M7Y5K9_9FIRM|nr:ABC transporter substrate-binding protein [Anaerocolumna xylanovorans]SHO47725.1 NitT/TauT family transport system substrate-binding protein [Anaerocolumna xylanovorans DSM 12503]
MMKNGRKRIGFILTAFLVAFSVIGCGKAETKTTKDTDSSSVQQTAAADGKLQPLRVAVMTGMFNHYTALIGKEQGIYKKHGIDLQLTEYPAGINTVDALVTGQADLGYVADFAIVNRIGNTLDSTNLEIVSEVQGGPVNGGLYVDPKYKDNLKELDGKGFINTVGTVSEYYNSKIFEYLGVDESKQKLLNSDNPQTSLALAQQGDAAAVFASGANANLYEGIGWVKGVDASELKINTYSFDVATKEYNKDNAALIAQYLQATQESYEYIVSHLDEAAAYLEKTLGVKADVVKADWSVAKSTIGFSEEGALQLETIEKWAYQKGKFKQDYAIRDYINTDALKIAFPDKITLAGK